MLNNNSDFAKFSPAAPSKWKCGFLFFPNFEMVVFYFFQNFPHFAWSFIFSDFDFGKVNLVFYFFQILRVGVLFFSNSETVLLRGLLFFSIFAALWKGMYHPYRSRPPKSGREGREGHVNHRFSRIFKCKSKIFSGKFWFFSELCHFPELLWIILLFFSFF